MKKPQGGKSRKTKYGEGRGSFRALSDHPASKGKEWLAMKDKFSETICLGANNGLAEQLGRH